MSSATKTRKAPKAAPQAAPQAAPGGGTVLGGPPLPDGGGTTLLDHAVLFHAVDSFVHDNSSFKSSVAIDGALEDLEQCTDLHSVFLTPLKHKLFTMDTALLWTLFLSVAPDRAVEEGDAPFSEGAKFSPEGAFAMIATVYDIGVQEAVWDHFEDDDDDDDFEDEDEGEPEAEAAAGDSGLSIY